MDQLGVVDQKTLAQADDVISYEANSGVERER